MRQILDEIRCQYCGKLFSKSKLTPPYRHEVKCTRCGKLNIFEKRIIKTK